MDTIRILALDGGGTRAGVIARALGEIYGSETPGRDIVRQFAYAAANSGGSIVLTALCCNYKPREIAEFYDDPATLKRMFSPKFIASIPILRKFVPRYSMKKKYAALVWMFDRRQQTGEPLPSTIKIVDWPGILGSSINLVVSAFDYDRRRATFFRSNPASLAKSSTPVVDATLVEAVHAATNAPIRYFDKPAAFLNHRYWDGAMGGYNNPALAAVVEALANRPAEADAFRVLSIGTGTQARPLTTEGAAPPLGKPPPGTGIFDALEIATTVIVDDPPDAASFHAHVALRQPLPQPGGTYSDGTLVRISPIVRPLWNTGRWELPPGFSAADFEALIEMDMDPMERFDLDLIAKMTSGWIAGDFPNQPIRMGEHLRCDIGHDNFPDAIAHWKRIA